MRAMILSAGYGTRLWPLTEDRTKPALPILGKPLVGYVAEYLAGFGCREILVNLHHRPESVRAALGDGRRFGVSLTYVEEPTILGTSGALDNARDLLDQGTFVVINGKIITDIDLGAALETHRQTKAVATLVLLPNIARERFSIVEVRDGFVGAFGGMPEPQSAVGRRQEQEAGDQAQRLAAADQSGDRSPHSKESEADAAVPLMFTGIQILEPRIFEYIPRGVFSHSTTDVYPQAIDNGELVAAHLGKEKWYELSTISRYLDISLTLLAEQGTTVFKGARSEIATNAQVSNSIIWDDVVVEAGASVNRAVLGDGVRIRQGEVIENAAVVRASLIRGSQPPAKALKGDLRGENFVVPLAQ
jgi:NDP-sugar pyrophosphorylase family protein